MTHILVTPHYVPLSSFIVMMIIGCAVSPPIMGFIADHMKNFSVIELIPALCYLYIAFYAFKKAVSK